jgi:hypothetical protein
LNGISSSDPDNSIVNISSINYHGGDNVFDTNVLQGNGETPEEVVGMVQPGTNGKLKNMLLNSKLLIMAKGEEALLALIQKLE